MFRMISELGSNMYVTVGWPDEEKFFRQNDCKEINVIKRNKNIVDSLRRFN